MVIAGGLAAALAVGAGGYMLGRANVEPERVMVPTPVPTAAPTPSPKPTGLPTVLERADILELARAAADAAASGRTLPPELAREAASRRFTLHLPFGCGGPAGDGSDAPIRWRYDEARGVLRLHVAPVTWEAEDWWPKEPRPEVEAIEGFWIGQPWSTSKSCPPVAGEQPDPLVQPGETLAIAQFFAAGASRQARRGNEPFESVVRISPAAFRGQQGFRVRLTGRIEQIPGDGPVRCVQPRGSAQRPICVVGASIEEVAIENTASGETLATWTLGRT